jgi:hypothetical protein
MVGYCVNNELKRDMNRSPLWDCGKPRENKRLLDVPPKIRSGIYRIQRPFEQIHGDHRICIFIIQGKKAQGKVVLVLN